ncbi:MAG: molybdenum cofactor cytidylyltransferase [Oceanicoccus sp.]|jgi:molybdenum cofactor cytidylyltransferase
MKPDFGILVLAAGKSSRFGSDKLLAKMSDGRPVIEHSLSPLQAIARKHQLTLCVITRADNQALIDYLTAKNILYTICPDAYLGMGHSISHGIKINQASKGWMVSLADMPAISLQIMEALMTNIIKNPEDIARPSFLENGKKIPSHPVYFPQKYGFELSQLTGDDGAKTIIKQQTLLDIIDEACLIDVDTPEALKQLNE